MAFGRLIQVNKIQNEISVFLKSTNLLELQRKIPKVYNDFNKSSPKRQIMVKQPASRRMKGDIK